MVVAAPRRFKPPRHRPDAVHDVFESGRREGEQAVKLLLFYALWHHIHALGHEPGPSLEETLAQG